MDITRDQSCDMGYIYLQKFRQHKDDNYDKSRLIASSQPIEVIENIYAYEVLINEEFSHLMLENGPHNPHRDLGEEAYFKVEGSFVFDTSGKTKKEIDEMALLQGIRIIDQDENEEILKFNSN